MRSIRANEPGQVKWRRWRQAYYITHVSNLESIITQGIYSHSKVNDLGLRHAPVYNEDVVNRRRARKTPAGRSLWDYANVYIHPRNPMLYTVVKKVGVEDVAVITVRRPMIYKNPAGAFITDGNAASDDTEFFPLKDKREAFARLQDVDGLEFWKPEDGTKRRIMAELLVPDRIPSDWIDQISVGTDSGKTKVEALLAGVPTRPQVVVEPYMFFLPDVAAQLTPNLSLVRGDMFFSGMQTLTVSVNTEGVMGRGLASRARYQFPDVYVQYEDLCKTRRLRMGRPFLYKRESALDLQLADEPEQLDTPNSKTWFLIFPTKNSWRQPADKEGVIEGLDWLVAHYQEEGITSIAVPALGCGLGWLEWAVMGPILCKKLAQLNITTQLYLPAERPIPRDQLTPEYLLH